MSELSEIKQTKEAKKEYYNPIINILSERMTKENIADILHCSERRVREIVSECAMYYAIVVYSNGKGYRRAKPIESLSLEELIEEYKEVRHSTREVNSRIKCLKKRLKPLIAYKKVAEKKLSEMGVSHNDIK